MDNRQLTDEEIEILVDRLCDRFEKKLYSNVGKGLMSMVGRGIIIVLIALAGYGAGIHFFK